MQILPQNAMKNLVLLAMMVMVAWRSEYEKGAVYEPSRHCKQRADVFPSRARSGSNHGANHLVYPQGVETRSGNRNPTGADEKVND